MQGGCGRGMRVIDGWFTLRVDGFESAEWSSGSIESSDAGSIPAQQ